jgi:hypothetical protein
MNLFLDCFLFHDICSSFYQSGFLVIGIKMKELGHLHVHDMAEWARRPAGFMHSSSRGIASAERGGYHIGRSLFSEMCGVRLSLRRTVSTLFGRKPKGGYIWENLQQNGYES